MRYSRLITILSITLGVSGASMTVEATPDTLGNEGSVKVLGSEKTKAVDPEHPETVVDPGPGPATVGSLRFDFISSLNFSSVPISMKTRKFEALAQQFFSETEPRGSYIQITDQRGKSTGWTVQVKQNYQFRNPVIQSGDEQELKGAVLSIDKGWANSSGDSSAPTVTRETIALTSIGTAYEIATAKKGEGRGVWTVEFGASATNENNQNATLTPIKDATGKPVIDKDYDKPAYSNSAVTLTIPESIKIYPVEYETSLTWIIGELP